MPYQPVHAVISRFPSLIYNVPSAILRIWAAYPPPSPLCYPMRLNSSTRNTKPKTKANQQHHDTTYPPTPTEIPPPTRALPYSAKSKPRYQKIRRNPTKILSEATRRQRKKNGTGKGPACPAPSRETRSRTTYTACRKVHQASSDNHSSHANDQQQLPRPRDPRSPKPQSEILRQPRPNLQTQCSFQAGNPKTKTNQTQVHF